MKNHPSCAVYWSQISQGHANRRVTDARNAINSPDIEVGGTLADAANPYVKLAEVFMDVENIRFQNPCIQYGTTPGSPYPIPLHDHLTTDSEYTIVAPHLKDIDPNKINDDRKADWVKTEWTKLKALISPVFRDFHRSGQHRANNLELDFMDPVEQERWMRHTRTKNRVRPEVSLYAYIILEKNDLVSMGKLMEVGAGRDESLLTDTSGTVDSQADSDEQGALSARRRKKKLKTSNSDDPNDAVYKAYLNEQLVSEKRHNCLTSLLQFVFGLINHL
jgi:hypothetical protein